MEVTWENEKGMGFRKVGMVTVGADWGRWMIAGNRLESIARMDGTEADGSISWCGHVALGIVFSICHCPCHLPNFSIH
ncbi:hypothetical protein ES332_D06G032900v1 [Gossypium tomentosum]|uniref:Uncharacterized protein n=1 Tax=Gossypium tomentosum TaxID=34277 RepID=A0A5D2KG62_GOSTO|nr:hypothetical protein ES332_D06G032900v1 [Gossypium tomentosum]